MQDTEAYTLVKFMTYCKTNLLFLNRHTMIPVKEDGTLYIELINKLPLDDYMDVMGSLSESQIDYYMANTLMEPSTGPVKPILEADDIIDLGWGVDAKNLLDQMKRQLDMRTDSLDEESK